jgi:hypothetical protein
MAEALELFLPAVSCCPIEPMELIKSALDVFLKAQNGVAMLVQGPLSPLVHFTDSQHVQGLARIAAQNIMALKILISTISRADVAQGAEQAAGAAIDLHQQQQQQQQPFKVTWDFKVALQHSHSMFYPVMGLKTASK